MAESQIVAANTYNLLKLIGKQGSNQDVHAVDRSLGALHEVARCPVRPTGGNHRAIDLADVDPRAVVCLHAPPAIRR